MTVAAAAKTGKVVQVIGPVVDIEFEDGHLPDDLQRRRITGDVAGAGQGKGAERIDRSSRSSSTSARTACARSR